VDVGQRGRADGLRVVITFIDSSIRKEGNKNVEKERKKEERERDVKLFRQYVVDVGNGVRQGYVIDGDPGRECGGLIV